MREILKNIMQAETVQCDRWAIRITPFSQSDTGDEAEERHIISNNYFSIGIDAKVALDFHLARQASPESFKSREMNKLKYFGYAPYLGIAVFRVLMSLNMIL